MKLLIIVLPFFIFGCATHGSYKAAMNSWANETVQHLEGAWGKPSVITENENKTIFSYNSATKTGAKCQSQFLTDKDKVLGWRSIGPGCLFTQEQVNQFTADSATWHTKETQSQERTPTDCISNVVGGIGFTSCN